MAFSVLKIFHFDVEDVILFHIDFSMLELLYKQ